MASEVEMAQSLAWCDSNNTGHIFRRALDDYHGISHKSVISAARKHMPGCQLYGQCLVWPPTGDEPGSLDKSTLSFGSALAYVWPIQAS